MASGRTMAFPAPSLRELLSAAKLRECTTVNVTAQKFQSLYALVCKSLAWRNHRTTLPQSRIRSTAPSEREPGRGLHHPSGYSLKSGVAGDFHRPYETLSIFTGYEQRSACEAGRFVKKPPGPGWGLGGGLGWGENQKLDLMVEIRMSPATTRSSGAKLCWKLSE